MCSRDILGHIELELPITQVVQVMMTPLVWLLSVVFVVVAMSVMCSFCALAFGLLVHAKPQGGREMGGVGGGGGFVWFKPDFVLCGVQS